MGRERAWKLETTGCRHLGGGLGDLAFFSGPRFPICRVKLGSFEGMGPEAMRAARHALNCPHSLHLFSSFGLGMLGTQLQKSETWVTLGTQILA